jgi:4-hydroxybenzoate polyprenyltransferase
MRKIWKAIFFGNYFYGLCAVALSIEASVQQNYPMNNPIFYVLIFFSTVIYYSLAFTQYFELDQSNNERKRWYQKNKSTLNKTLVVHVFIVAACFLYFIISHFNNLFLLNIQQILLTLIFPLLALFYYKIENDKFSFFKLRRIGWLKPFIIGICWAGIVTIYPIIFYHIYNATTFNLNTNSALLFLINFIFISVLSIMFDIKDYAADSNEQLKTFVVKYGLRKTISLIIIPMALLGLMAFIFYAINQQFSSLKILLNALPLLLMLFVAASLRKRKPILFYLIIIDGLMLFKAFCGCFSALFL